MRIAVLQFAHETVTFLPNDTTREDFIYPGSPAAARRCSPPTRRAIWAASYRSRANMTMSS
jgi:microcystin degradation protein MlrC